MPYSRLLSPAWEIDGIVASIRSVRDYVRHSAGLGFNGQFLSSSYGADNGPVTRRLVRHLGNATFML